ncbi:hypothetical protein FB446DRAFT_676608, partial [Lentinula raphanica]
MNKKKTEIAWKQEWDKRSVTGRYAIANRFPPTLKPTERLKTLKRELFGRLVQCRTGHAYIGEYYSKFVPGKNIDCPCGEALQTREHILRECPQYHDFRYVLEKASPDVILADILGTSEGVEALSEFLELSGAFTRTGKHREPPEGP